MYGLVMTVAKPVTVKTPVGYILLHSGSARGLLSGPCEWQRPWDSIKQYLRYIGKR